MLTNRLEAAERVAWAVANARSGAGGAVLVVGEPGSGKSTLLDGASRRAGDAVVLRATGVPVERALTHSALHALLWPVIERIRGLPDVQREALEVALGHAAGAAPSPFLLGAATLTLLAATADDCPVVVIVDDAQWVDPASVAAVAFAARRLSGERVGVLVAARVGEVPEALRGLEVCHLGRVSDIEAPGLLAETGVAPSVAVALARATDGNLLAMVELARQLDDEQRSGTAPLPTGPAPAALFAPRATSLPETARDAAALSALADGAPPAVLVAARTALRLPARSLRPAEDAGLLEAAADGVRWRHPTARAAVLDATPPSRRRSLAAALATAAESVGSPEAVVVELRLAAADGPDEALSMAVERVAGAADRTGDHQRAALLWARAAEVGADAHRHTTRVLESAQSLLRAGRLADARERYDAALRGGLDAEGTAHAQLALGRIEHLAGSPRVAVERFRAAAAAAPSVDLRVRACADGVLAAMYAASPQDAQDLASMADEAHDPAIPSQRLLVLHARGVAARMAGDVEGAATLLLASVAEASDHPQILEEEPDLVLRVITAPLFIDRDPDVGSDVAVAAIDRLRLRGDLLWLPRVVRLWGVRHLLAGRVQAGYAAIEEAVELSRAAGQTTQLVDGLGVLAWLEAQRGERETCLAYVAELESLSLQVDVPFLAANAWHARGLMHLGLGEATAAAAALSHAVELADDVTWRVSVLDDLVEALVLDGRRDEARELGHVPSGGRAAGILAEDDAHSVEILLATASEVDDPIEVARCRLLAGERLRRAGLRREAREHLRAAADEFARSGATPWRRRAELELQASGAALSKRYDDEALTGAELRVAALVAEGRPTREVAALLFLSPKTVEFHLGRIYRKLGVRGRAELAHRLRGAAD